MNAATTASVSVERKSRVSGERTSIGETTDEVEQTTVPVKTDIAIVKFSKEEQETLKITIGVYLTIDRPWKTVPKETLVKILEAKESKVTRKLKSYKFSEVLVGYQAGVEGSENHLVCLTEKGREKVLGELSILHYTLTEKVRQYLNRSPHRPHKPYTRPPVTKPQRPPISYEWVGQTASRTRKVNFGYLVDSDPTYNHILCRNKDSIKLVYSAVQHAQVLATPEFKDSSVQTEPEITINDCTQFVPELDLPSFIKLSPEGEAKLAGVCNAYSKIMLEATGYNALFDLYKDDYSELLKLGTPLSIAKTSMYKHYMSFNDISQFEGKIITALSWHPDLTGTVAVAYGTLTANKNVRLQSDSEDENYKSRGDLDVWDKKSKIKSVEDKDTSERNTWIRSINRIEMLMGLEYNENHWKAAETTLDAIEATMKLREFEIHLQKMKEEMIPVFDSETDEFDMYYIPYGTSLKVNTRLMKSMAANG